jgi:hypothetical protein
MFALYSAGQYAVVYPLIDAHARAAVPEHKWVAVHEKCPPQAAGLAYKVGRPVMAGQTAVMAVSLAGVASSLGSEEESFVYQDGGWFWAPSESDIAAYKGTVAHIVANAQGCRGLRISAGEPRSRIARYLFTNFAPGDGHDREGP